MMKGAQMSGDKAVVTLPQWECVRCGHTWTPRKQTRPVQCPNCKNAQWDRPQETEAEGRAKSEERQRPKGGR